MRLRRLTRGTSDWQWRLRYKLDFLSFLESTWREFLARILNFSIGAHYAPILAETRRGNGNALKCAPYPIQSLTVKQDAKKSFNLFSNNSLGH